MNTFFAVSFIHFQKNPRITRLQKKPKVKEKKNRFAFIIVTLSKNEKKKREKRVTIFVSLVPVLSLARS